MKTKTAAAFVAVAMIGASAGAANAVTGGTILYDNLDTATVGAGPYSDNELGPIAASFSTGGAAVSLGTVSVLLQELLTDPPSDYATIALLGDDNTSPGAVIATVGTVYDSQLTFSPSTFSFSGGEQLAANTRYWIEITGTTYSVGAWNAAADDSGTGVANEYFSTFNGVAPNAAGAFQMEVTAEPAGVSAAPEPSAWLLMIAGVGGVGLLLRRATKCLGLQFKGVVAA